ncbi:MAG: hypothetical protein AAGA54_20905 [Myxococcota bacterium]
MAALRASALFSQRSARALSLASILLAGCFTPGGAPVSGGTDGGSSSTGGADDAVPDPDSSSEAGDAESTTGGDDLDAEQACAEYCEIITDHCQDDDAQFSGAALCESTCQFIPPGTPGDALGNSVACRTFHGILAAEDPSTHCLHAGPAGDGTCGADCESFCSLAFNTCPGDLSPYPDVEACVAACETYPVDPPYSAEVPDGDTFACRLRHLTLASAQPDIHCSHVAEVSPVCF